MRLLRHAPVVLLAVQLTGLPWLGLQAVSKAQQTYRNARVNGLAAALKQIPKGKGNCNMCKKIKLAKAQHDRQQHDGLQLGYGSLGLMPAVLAVNVSVLPPQCENGRLIAVLPVCRTFANAPPTPPPRV